MTAYESRVARVLVAIAIVIIARLCWAFAVHHDWRCAFAQCRIETP